MELKNFTIVQDAPANLVGKADLGGTAVHVFFNRADPERIFLTVRSSMVEAARLAPAIEAVTQIQVAPAHIAAVKKVPLRCGAEALQGTCTTAFVTAVLNTDTGEDVVGTQAAPAAGETLPTPEAGSALDQPGAFQLEKVAEGLNKLPEAERQMTPQTDPGPQPPPPNEPFENQAQIATAFDDLLDFNPEGATLVGLMEQYTKIETRLAAAKGLMQSAGLKIVELQDALREQEQRSTDATAAADKALELMEPVRQAMLKGLSRPSADNGGPE